MLLQNCNLSTVLFKENKFVFKTLTIVGRLKKKGHFQTIVVLRRIKPTFIKLLTFVIGRH